MRVGLLRAWYFLRELLGCPRRLTGEEFDKASATVLLAGSPWMWVSPETTAATSATLTVAVTNTTWSRRIDGDA
jgi:hypothetical protein